MHKLIRRFCQHMLCLAFHTLHGSRLHANNVVYRHSHGCIICLLVFYWGGSTVCRGQPCRTWSSSMRSCSVAIHLHDRWAGCPWSLHCLRLCCSQSLIDVVSHTNSIKGKRKHHKSWWTTMSVSDRKTTTGRLELQNESKSSSRTVCLLPARVHHLPRPTLWCGSS